MQSPLAMHLSPRCGAKTRSARLCRSPAMPNGRCRMHGEPRLEAPEGERNGNWRNGRYTNEVIEMRQELNEWIRLMRRVSQRIGKT
ncbi:HGGxSTG domain-containing protein [Methylobacterium sp. P31]